MDLSKVYVADFETTPYTQYLEEGKTRVRLSYFENLIDPENNSMDLTLNDFMLSLLRKQKDPKKMETFTCYFHNLKFDGEFMLWWLKNNNFVEHKSKGKMKPGHYSIIMSQTGVIYSLVIQFKQRMRVKFLDSYLILNRAVGDLPGSTKGVIDYHEHHYETTLAQVSEEEKDYIKNDVKSVIRALRPVLAFGSKGITSSGMAYNSFKEIIENSVETPDWYKLFPEIAKTPEDYQEIRKYYTGGFTYLNPHYKNTVIDDWVVSFDINSSYPAIMYYETLPYGKPFITEDEEEFNKYKDKFKLFMYEVHVTIATLKPGHHPFISVNGGMEVSKSYQKELIGVKLYMTNIDFAMLEDYYEGHWEIKKWWCFKGVNGIFKEYIDYWMAEKIRCQEAGDAAGKQNAKLHLNQLYGKFVTDHNRMSKHPDFSDPDTMQFTQEETVLNSRYYWYMGIFIASYAREKVIRPIQYLRDNFIYCDTDSIHITTKDPYYRPDCFEYHDTKLGAWGFEGASVKSKWLKRKQYIKHKLYDENMQPCDEKYRRIASLSRKHHGEVWFDNFKPDTPIKNGRMRPMRVRGGICLVESDLVFRSGNSKKREKFKSGVTI